MRKFLERFLFMVFGGVLTLLFLYGAAILQSRTPAAIAKTRVILRNYSSATTNFFKFAGRWPTSETELVTNPLGIVFINAPVGHHLDGWERPIVFEPFTTNRGYGRFISYGRDGKAGGDGANADLEVRFP